MMKYLLLLSNLLFCADLYAQGILSLQNNTMQAPEYSNALYPGRWNFDCQLLGNQHIKFEFVSKSGDALENDVEVFMTPLNGQRVKLLVPKDLYTGYGVFTGKNFLPDCGRVDLAPAKASFSPRVGAILIRHKFILTFLTVDHRPDLDRLRLVLIDLQTGKILDQLKPEVALRYGELNALIVRKYRYGIQLRAVRESAELACDCIEDYIEDWLNIRVDEKGKIHTTWHSPLTPALKKMPKP